MSNSWFQFKQFRIEQDNCAMKVTTDACIQGAWTPILPGVKRVLDIGAGTGLLSLMLAQRNTGLSVNSIELDANSAQQAAENINNSKWRDSITVLNIDIRDYVAAEKYDLIISNPPFFNNSLLGNNLARNQSRHTSSLSYTELLKAIYLNLGDDGYVSVLMPYPEYVQFRDAVSSFGFVESARLDVRHTDQSEVKRVVCLFSKREMDLLQKEELIIKDNNQVYTPAFKALLSQFYLHL